MCFSSASQGLTEQLDALKLLNDLQRFDQNIDTRNAPGRLSFYRLGEIAQFEMEIGVG